MRTAAKTISIIFHPLLLTTYMVLSLGFFFPAILGINTSVIYLFTLFIFVITFLLPALNIALMLKFSGADASLNMVNRKDRRMPFILISLIYAAVTYLFFYKAILGMNFIRIMIIITALVVVATLITFFYKISVHSLAAGGFVGIILPMNKIAGDMLLWPTVIIIVITGVIMSARLLLNAHTPREVMSGGLIGFLLGLSGMLLLF